MSSIRFPFLSTLLPALLPISLLGLPLMASAAPLTLADLRPGDLLVTEYLADPVGVNDAQGEYFEILNLRDQAVDLEGLTVRDDGSNQFSVSGVSIAAGGFAVFASNDGSDLGFSPDFVYGARMSLTNTDDEIVLVGAGGTTLHTLRYTDGDAFGDGIAHELRVAMRGLTDSSGPALGDDFVAAGNALALGNFGSPGFAGNTRIDVSAVPVPPALWLFGSGLVAAFTRLRFRRR
ncbi:MAG TPA: lamin tail domain-containing protein [Chromatiales bacterium]|nr:lamin tail domain-containing protein [Chromatiales bacterium]